MIRAIAAPWDIFPRAAAYNERSMRPIARMLFLVLLASPSYAQPNVFGVTNGASYSGNLAPGAWATIFGSRFATTTAVADSVPLPNQLNGVSVTIGGLAAPMRYVSPNQINFVIPFELTLPRVGSPVPLAVMTPAGKSSPFAVLLSRDSPGLFTQDSSVSGNVWVFDASFNPVPAVGTDPLIFYASGLGPTNPPGASASGGASTEPLNRIQDNLSVFVGDKQADILFAGLAPGFPGIYQLNVLPHGAVTDRVYLKINGWQSNIATVPVAAGSNVANVTATIDGLYPSTLPIQIGVTAPINTSVMLTAAQFSTSFDILPNAKPFSVVATTEGGVAIITIDPSQGAWQATLSVPANLVRLGRFDQSEFVPVLDFVTCGPAGCSAFPNSVVPLVRLDATLLRAENLIPLPNSTPTSATGVFSASGTFSGSHFDTSTIPMIALTSFGGFIQIPHAGPSNRVTRMSVYVDGKQVAFSDVPYSVL